MPLLHKDEYHVTPVNPAAVPGQIDGQEYKYERVETAKVDTDGVATVVDAREDRGNEDPGMNYQDKRPPGLDPGAPIGLVASSVTGLAPEQPVHKIPGPFIAGNPPLVAGFDRNMSNYDRSPDMVRETTVVKEKSIISN